MQRIPLCASVVLVLCAVGTSARGITEGGCLIEPCPSHISNLLEIQVLEGPHAQRGVSDCYVLIASRSAVRQRRYWPGIRRSQQVREVRGPDGAAEGPTAPNVVKFDGAVAAAPVSFRSAESLAAAEDGKMLFVGSPSTTSVLRFRRDPESGHLTFAETQRFGSRAEVEIFMAETRRRWVEDQHHRVGLQRPGP